MHAAIRARQESASKLPELLVRLGGSTSLKYRPETLHGSVTTAPPRPRITCAAWYTTTSVPRTHLALLAGVRCAIAPGATPSVPWALRSRRSALRGLARARRQHGRRGTRLAKLLLTTIFNNLQVELVEHG